METNHSDQSIDDEPDRKRPKLDTAASSSSTGTINSKAIDDCPILMLPPDILAKILAFVPIAQWPALELLYDFRPAVLIAWRQLRRINVEQQLLYKSGNENDRSSSIVSILQKLADRSPFLTSVSGINMHPENTESNSNAVRILAQFEHLQSISMGPKRQYRPYFPIPLDIPLENVIDFLESTRSRTNLKDVQLVVYSQRQNSDNMVVDRYSMLSDPFASSFVNGREVRLPLKLERFLFWTFYPLLIRLDTMDTSRLTELLVREAWIAPDQLTNLCQRASHLRRVELSFLHCGKLFVQTSCNGPRLQANKKLLTALASLEDLTTLKFGSLHCNSNDRECLDFQLEFIQMLKTIGGRGQLTKLSLEHYFVWPPSFNMKEICATIHDYIPYLQSIKIYITAGMSSENVSDIISLPELEEIEITGSKVRASAIKPIVQLAHLKRLALREFVDEDDMDSLIRLADAMSLMDLRIRYTDVIDANVFEKWSHGFASNLQILMLGGIGEEYEDDEDETDEDDEDENDEEQCKAGGTVENDSDDEEHNDAEDGLAKLLEKAVRLRVLILVGHISDRILAAIANSCPHLEIFSALSKSDGFTAQRAQEIVDRCPRLKGLSCRNNGDELLDQLQLPKYRKFNDVELEWFNYELDDDEYD